MTQKEGRFQLRFAPAPIAARSSTNSTARLLRRANSIEVSVSVHRPPVFYPCNGPLSCKFGLFITEQNSAIVAHQFRHARRGPRGPKRRTGGSRNQPCSCNRSSSCRHSWSDHRWLASIPTTCRSCEISALVHDLRPTFVMQFRSFYS
jgi:hypothetical protein